MAKKFKPLKKSEFDIVDVGSGSEMALGEISFDADEGFDVSDNNPDEDASGQKVEYKRIDDQGREQVDDLKKSLTLHMAKERERYLIEADGSFWFAVVFSSEGQKLQFLRETGLDAYGSTYLDGRIIAKKFFDVELQPVVLHKPHLKIPDKRYAALSRELKPGAKSTKRGK